MEPKKELGPLPDPDELMRLASAIAAREQKELEFGRLVTNAAVEPDNPSAQTDALINGAIRNLLRLQNPENKDYLLQMLTDEFKTKSQSVVDEVFRLSGKQITIDEAEELVLNRAMDWMDTIGQTED